MLQVVLVTVLIYSALKCFAYKDGYLALVMFFLEHGVREPNDEEIKEYQRRVLENIARDVFHNNA